MKKLDNKTYKLRKLFDFIGVIFLVMLLMFVWQLYRGSIAVPFLKPYIIKALNHDDTEYQVTLDSVNLELVRSIKPLRIIANNVVYKKADGGIVINAPKTSVSFSIKALLHGVVAPSSIEIAKPAVYIFTDYGSKKEQPENISQKKAEYYFDIMQDFLERFNSEDNSYPESYINSINIEDASVEFHEVDLGKKWVLSDVNYRFDRGLTQLSTSVQAGLKFNGQPASVGMELVYRPIVNKVALQFYFSDIIPADLLEFLTSAEHSGAYKINIPLNGKIEALVNLDEVVKNKNNLLKSVDTSIENIQFALEGGNGVVNLTDDAAQDYKISSVVLKGEISGGLDKISIKDAVVELDGQQAQLGLEASGLKDYLLKSSLKNLQLSLTAKVKEMETDRLYTYWPQFVANNAWTWCRSSLSAGKIKNAEFRFDFAADKKSGKLIFADLKGTAYAEGVSLDYLTGMPKVTGIYGHVDFFKDKLQMYFDKGVSADVILNKGYIELYDLDKNDNFAKINIEGSGGIPDILRLIDNPPLGFTSQMGISPDSIKGSADIRLGLELELKKNLAPHEVKVDIAAGINDVSISGIVEGKTIEANRLNMTVTNQGMEVAGVASFDGIPLNLKWNENFASKDYLRRYQLSFNFDANLKQKAGIDFPALSAPYIRGSIPTLATITAYKDDQMEIDIDGNLQGANIDYSFLGFKKKAGVEGVISSKILLKGCKVVSIPSFSLSKPNFSLKGKIELDAAGNVRLIDVSDIKGPNTDARARIEMAGGRQDKVKIAVSGKSYNLADFFNKDQDEIKADKERRRQMRLSDALNRGKKDEKDDWEDVSNTDINIAVDSLWTNNDVAIRHFAGTAKLRKGVGVEEMHLIGNFASSRKNGRMSNLKLDYVPRPKKEYLLTIESNDAGSTLKFLRLYDNMRGGRLSINAKRNADKTFVGHAKIRDFNVYNTPVFAKLLTVASLTGMVNLLTGEGIAFSHFDAPFEYAGKMLKVKEGRAFGNVVGISGSGTYSMKYQDFDIKGMIAPAYGLNTFIGSIPLVGGLLSGKDGTVFAATYTIRGDVDDPDIGFNPLSALSPNSLKELVNSTFGKQDE